MIALTETLPEGDYRFQLSLRRTSPREFFATQDPTGAIVAERRRWLAAEPNRYLGITPAGEPLVAEFASLCRAWEIGPSAADETPERPQRLAQLAATLEPDLLFLAPEPGGVFCLQGGALCFPTGWALEEKLGRALDVIHGPVPGLNATLGKSISQFLAHLRPDLAYCRDNWGLAATAELNLHPGRALPAPGPPVSLAGLWLRVEHQALLALPQSGGVVFGIRIALHRLDAVALDRAMAARLGRLLASMPDSVARYKRLDAIRQDVINLL